MKELNLVSKASIMNCYKSLLVCSIFSIFNSITAYNQQPIVQSVSSNSLNGKPNYVNINQVITLRSDFPSQSVLLSNLLPVDFGDKSPIIAAALWSDNGKQLECKSLIKFNFDYLPKIIFNNPYQINSATLILFPLQEFYSKDDLDKPLNIFVNRINENWVDSTTNWLNQPSIDSSVLISKVIKATNKNDFIKVDVTKLFIKMIQHGNHGFLIHTDSSSNQSYASGQFFASPKHEDEDFRPILVIDYQGKKAYEVYDRNRNIQDLKNQSVSGRLLLNQSVYQHHVEPINHTAIIPEKVEIKKEAVKN